MAGFEVVMKTLAQTEAIQWCRARKLEIKEGPPPEIVNSELDSLRVEVPKLAEKHFWFSRLLEKSLGPWNRCLFWVTTYGVWQNAENWHLYYRLRQSYGDLRLIEDAPAHLFLQFESHDLTTFIQIALGAGWDFTLLTDLDYNRIAVSHDEFVDFFSRTSAELDNIKADMLKAGVKLLTA